ncbi:hypothetical protein HZ326_12823 [Fusarium oxysporum f. sp. albedinis]|nr:hypothetical protein HZ326_12823 [Fusarium oxysporum f. sp. albedinis]
MIQAELGSCFKRLRCCAGLCCRLIKGKDSPTKDSLTNGTENVLETTNEPLTRVESYRCSWMCRQEAKIRVP